MVVGQAAGHRFRFLCCPQSDAKGSPFEMKAPISNIQQFRTLKAGEVITVLTCQKNSELLVVELRLFLGQQAALGALSHRVHEAHAGQHHLVAAALITETAAAAPAVMLQETGRHNQPPVKPPQQPRLLPQTSA